MGENTEPVFNGGGTGLEGRVLGREEPIEDWAKWLETGHKTSTVHAPLCGGALRDIREAKKTGLESN